jgi:alpha-tubulin suppressor-like RCC1 family protein
VKIDATTTLSGVIDVGANSDTYNGSTTECAVTKTGSLYCWGGPGSGAFPGVTQATPYATLIHTGATGPALTGATMVAVGPSHVCALVSGQVTCWGTSDGTQFAKAYPLLDNPKLAGIKGTVKKLQAGAGFTCALTDNAGGSVYCWGENSYSQLGRGPTTPGTFSTTANPVLTDASTALTGAVDLAVGSGVTCAVRTDHSVYCWGNGGALPYAAQLKDSAMANVTDAVSVSIPSTLNQLRYIGTDGAYHALNGALTIVPDCTTQP